MSSIALNVQSTSLQQDRHVAMMKLLRTLRKEFPELKNSDDFFLALIGAVGMSRRAVLPVTLADSVIGQFIKEYASELGVSSLSVDSTAFAGQTIRTVQAIQAESTAQFQSLIQKNLTKLVKAISAFHASAALDESLAAGWFRQCLIKASGVDKNIVEGHRTRADLDDIPNLTQWFTPGWIADFLIEECIDENPHAVFLDPACGAGHLLVPALRKLMALNSGYESDSALEKILEKQLFGIDIDQRLIDLAKLAVYLETREKGQLFELPIPRIYKFGDNEEAQTIGSLLLAAKKTSATSERNLPAEISATYDAIAMNPPYLGHRIMPQSIRDFLKAEFPDSQYDLYAAFLDLGLRLLKPGGKLAAISQQSVLTIQRYQSLRETMVGTAELESLAQLGSGVFATKGGEKTNTAIISLRKRGTTTERDVRCWQMLTKQDKIIAETGGIKRLPHTTIARKDALAIAAALPQSPFSYWAPPEILRLFSVLPPIIDPSHKIACTNGLFTCNNEKFVKRFDEIPPELRNEFVPYDKGGGHKWYRTSPLMLHWKADGQEIRDYRVKRGQSAKMPGEQFYFRRGVTYSYIGTRGFKARLLTPNSVFDIASSAIFSTEIDVMFILGFLNSSLVRSILGILNPTVNFQIGDIRRIPFKCPSPDIEAAISDLSSRAVDIAVDLETLDPASPRFGSKSPPEQYSDIPRTLESWAKEEAAIQKELDEIIFDFYKISSSCRIRIQQDPWVSRGAEAFRKQVFSSAQL